MVETVPRKKAPKKKAADRKPPKLVVSFNVMCSNHRHLVGLTGRGQLHFPSHTVKELERELLFRTMGGQPCKCADILDVWRKGEDFGFQVPGEFLMERHNQGGGRYARKARRALRRLKKGRTLRPARAPGKADGEPEKVTRHEAIVRLVAAELVRRGREVKATSEAVRCADMPKPAKYENDPHELKFSGHSVGSVTYRLAAGGQLGLIPSSKQEDPPVKQLADIVERNRIEYLMAEAETRNYDARLKVIKDYSTEVRKKYSSKHVTTKFQEADGLFNLTISFDGLTVQALEKMLEAYEAARGKMVRYRTANRKRADSKTRYPDRPRA